MTPFPPQPADPGGFDAFLAPPPPTTRKTYMVQFRKFQAWLGPRPASRDLAQAWLDELRAGKHGREYSNNTLSTCANALRRYFRWKYGAKIELDAPGMEFAEPKYISFEQYQALLAKCNPMLGTLVALLWDTASRISEILNASVSDVDWEQEIIHVTRKGGRKSWALMTDEGSERLKAWLKSRHGGPQASPWLFKDYVDYGEALEQIKAASQAAGLPEGFTPHWLRHSRNHYLEEQGVPLEQRSQLLDHVNLNTTAKMYGRKKPADLRKAIAG